MTRVLGKVFFGAGLSFLFLLPFFGFLSAEPVPYRDPGGIFSVNVPEGWSTDDSGHMGPGVVMKGPAGEAGVDPVMHLLHEKAGIVTLDVQWPAYLGRIRYEREKVKFVKLEDFDEAKPPFSEARYSFVDGGRTYGALSRMFLSGGRFFLITATAPEGEFDEFLPLFRSTFNSLLPGEGG